MVVPFAADGPADTVGRILAPGLSEHLGQQVIIENVGGSGGMTGASRVAKAAPDGHQFVLGNVGTHAANQTFYKTPLYNAATERAETKGNAGQQSTRPRHADRSDSAGPARAQGFVCR
jgi:hypothetical protein